MESKEKTKINSSVNQPPPDYDPNLCWPPVYAIGLRFGPYHWNTGMIGKVIDHFYDFNTMASTKEEVEAKITKDYESNYVGYKCFARDVRWRSREQHKAEMKSRTDIKWFHKDWWYNNEQIYQDHFVQVSETDPTLLSYVQDASKGQRGIRTPIKPGKYLTKFFSHLLSPKEILFYATWQATGTIPSEYNDEKNYKVSFATTPDEIEQVYITGPKSCMSHDMEDGRFIHSKQHPTRIYGAGDLAVAYLHEDKNGEQGRIVARCLVWPEKKVAGRIYPNVDFWRDDNFESREDAEAAYNSLQNRLTAQNYDFTKDLGFDGAKLLRIHCGKSKTRIVMPYLDKNYRFNVANDGKCLIMDRRGEYHGNSIEGYACINSNHPIPQITQATLPPEPVVLNNVSVANVMANIQNIFVDPPFVHHPARTRALENA